VTTCVLDADVVIAALDRADGHHGAAVRAVTRMLDEGTGMLLSVVNYAEALLRPAERDDSFRAAVAGIDALGLELVAPTAAVAREAARLRNAGISLPDGFAVATAVTRGASLIAFDARVRRIARREGVQLEPTSR
jgi:predicted nucleic acid-binding protein